MKEYVDDNELIEQIDKRMNWKIALLLQDDLPYTSHPMTTETKHEEPEHQRHCTKLEIMVQLSSNSQ